MVDIKKTLRDIFIGYWKSLVVTALFWTVVTSYGSWAPRLDAATGGLFAVAVDAWRALAFGPNAWVAAVLFYAAGIAFWYMVTRSWHGSAYRFLVTFMAAAGSHGVMSGGGVATLSLLWVVGMFSVIGGYLVKAALVVSSLFDRAFTFLEDGRTIMSKLPKRIRRRLKRKGITI